MPLFLEANIAEHRFTEELLQAQIQSEPDSEGSLIQEVLNMALEFPFDTPESKEHRGHQNNAVEFESLFPRKSRQKYVLLQQERSDAFCEQMPQLLQNREV